MFLIMFKTGHAEPLRQRRTWCPRMRRGEHAEYPRNSSCSWTWQRPVHGLDSAAHKTRPGTFRVHEQCASTISPRQLTRPRTIHVRAQSTDLIVREQATTSATNRPKTVRIREVVASAIYPRPWTGKGLSASRYRRCCPDGNHIPNPSPNQSSVCPHLTQPQSAKRSRNSRHSARRSSKPCFRPKRSYAYQSMVAVLDTLQQAPFVICKTAH